MAREKSNGHKTETPDVSHIRNVEVTHETSDINVRGVLTFVVVLTIGTIAISIGMWVLFRFFERQQAREPGPGPMALTQKDRLPPEPRLQAAPGFAITTEDNKTTLLERAAPQEEYRVLRRHWEQILQQGVKDPSGNTVSLPIEAAIDKVVSEGLPSRTQGTPMKLQDYAIGMPTAASSGREVEKRLQ